MAGLGLAALMKGKALLGVVKLLPASKLMITSLSRFAMVAFEAQRTGIWFAIGFVLLILVHELGHGYAHEARRRRERVAGSSASD